jgi:zinc protease
MILGLSACAQFGKNPSPADIPTIANEKYVLENGLTVLIHEDHSDPVVHVDVTYHVGSAREKLGKSGFAHLFEHMMFQGSENVADEEHIKTVTAAGGSMNGTTNRDRTNYFETVPSNQLETMLWLEADRMGFFLEGITQEKFEIQRATVKNEKLQNYDNRAYGRVFELIAKGLYPSGHPYSWLTIGEMEDLDRATAEDLREFFLTWYGPNNATLTIAGDVEPDDVMTLVKKYFGSIHSGPEVEAQAAMPVTLDADRYLSYHDKNIQFPAVTLTYPTVEYFHPDAPALSCLAEILGRGKGSYLYQNLVATGKAIQASASHNENELAGEFFMFVLPYPGQSLSAFETELRNALAEFEKNGVSEEDLQKYKARYETSLINGLEKVSGKASQLAFFQTFAGATDKLKAQAQAHLSLTAEDVMAAYEKYIKAKPAVILSVLAKTDGEPARADNFAPQKQPNTNENQTQPAALTYKKPNDEFDRSIKPSPSQAKLVKPPEHWTQTLNNGIRVIGSESDELPKLVLSLKFPGGINLDAANQDKLGTASLLSDLLNASTENFTEEQMANELDKLGSRISISAGQEFFYIQVSTLTRNFDATMALLEEKLMRPAFNIEEFNRYKNETIESAKSSTKQTSSIAEMVYNKLIYGENNLLGVPNTELISTVPNIGIDDIRTMYTEKFGPNNAEIVAVGNLDRETIIKGLDFLNDWNKGSDLNYSLQDTPSYSGTPLYFVHHPGAAQSEIRVGYLSDLQYSATGEFFQRGLMNFILGGAFNSRINLNLREEKGLTYGARSRFEGDKQARPFTVSTSVKSQGTGTAVKEIMKEIQTIQTQQISEDELQFLKQAVGQRDALNYESNGQKASILGRMLHFNIAPDFVDKQKSELAAITQNRILELAQTHLPTEKMFILVVGNKNNVLFQLKNLDFDVIELDREGNAIK